MYSKLSLLCICFIFFGVVQAEENTKPMLNEIQVLIDVSGSMKKNDPNNLRIPAIKLLINLLPEGTRAGIWLFAENSSELVKTGRVDQKWKKNALLKVNKIHSRGLFTHIEEAIDNASASWFESTDQQNRHLILLTDGMVDVSKDFMQSAESRDRIMNQQLPLLQQAGVQVQTIALSADADTELLNKLAFDTLGWPETVLAAEQLQKVFFKLFQQAVPQDTVSITDNKFSVDASIKEFSVLIFKQAGAETELIAPDKSKLNSASKLEGISWLNEKNYDLVTIRAPKAGEWKINAATDPDNKVMIVTDLKFEIDELPNNISLTDSLEITVFFTDQQQLISRQDFLNLIDISVQQLGGKKWQIPAVIGKQGLFSRKLVNELKEGRHTLKIKADGKTFNREVIKVIEVVKSLVTIEKQVDLVARTISITLKADKSVINTDMMAIEATISQQGEAATVQDLQGSDGQWRMLIKAPESGVRMLVNFSIMANTLQGSAISPHVPAIVIDDRLFDTEKPEQQLVEPIQKETIEVESGIVDSEEIKADENQDSIPEEPINWGKTAVIILLINVIVFVIGFLIFKFMKKRASAKQDELLSRLD